MDLSNASGLPVVSMMVVTRNRLVELRRCLESVRAQTYKGRIEVVVLDDGGDVDPSVVVKEIFPDCLFMRLHKQMGACTAKNLAIANCNGKYVYCLDDDGWLAPEALEIAVLRAEANALFAVVVSSIYQMRDGVVDYITAAPDVEASYLHTFPGGASLIRRDYFVNADWYPDDFNRQADEEHVAVRIFDMGGFIVLEPRSIMYHQPSPIGRSNFQIAHYDLRNANRSAIRMYPWPYNFLRIASNFVHSFRYAVRQRMFSSPALLVWDILLELTTQRGRKCKRVSVETMRKFFRKSPLGPNGDEKPAG